MSWRDWKPGVAYDTTEDAHRARVFGLVMCAAGIFLGVYIGVWLVSP